MSQINTPRPNNAQINTPRPNNAQLNTPRPNNAQLNTPRLKKTRIIRPKRIGEGAYGCVHKPPLRCVDQEKQDSTSNVSKLMTNKDAQEELNEYFLISKADKNGEYHLGKPSVCEPSKIPSNLLAIKDCKNIRPSVEDMNKFSLLIMKNGGYNIEQFSELFKKQHANTENMEQIVDFLIEGIRLLEGLELFLDNDIIHHDLKSQNIVYNPKENRINFIDFGLMDDMKNVRSQAIHSDYGYDIHWSFPFEIALWNKNDFDTFVESSIHDKEVRMRHILKKIEKKCPYFFEVIYNNDKQSIKNHITEFMNFLDMIDSDYDQFLDKSISTFDLYGVGIAFMDFYNNTEHILETIELEMNLKTNKDTHLSSRFKNLFMSMVDPNVYNRTTVMAALHEYQNILVDSGILDTHSKPHSKMLQQTVDNIASIRKTSSSVAKEISTTSLPAQKEEIRESVPKRLCPEGKEYNKRTKRCVKKCKEGSRRNKNFRCVKIPKSKTQKKKKSLGPCSEGKERNPNTNRCVKKCKPGYKRNESFKCVKSKN